MDFKECKKVAKFINAHLNSDIAHLSILGMFGDIIKYYILGYAGEAFYLCIWTSDTHWGICTVVSQYIEPEPSEFPTLGSLCKYLCKNYI